MTPQIHSEAQYTEPLKLDVLYRNYTDTENWALENFMDNPDHPAWARVTELFTAYESAKQQYRIPQQHQEELDDDFVEMLDEKALEGIRAEVPFVGV